MHSIGLHRDRVSARAKWSEVRKERKRCELRSASVTTLRGDVSDAAGGLEETSPFLGPTVAVTIETATAVLKFLINKINSFLLGEITTKHELVGRVVSRCPCLNCLAT